MGCLWSCCKKVLLVICGLIKLGLAIAIVIIISLYLFTVDITLSTSNASYEFTCLMSTGVYSGEVCEYAYAVCGISILAQLCLSIFLCVTCDCCGCGSWIEFAGNAALCAWWVIASIVFVDRGSEANDANVPNQNWRNSVIVMAFVAVIVTGIAALVCLIDAVKCLTDCCCCCCDRDDKKDNKV